MKGLWHLFHMDVHVTRTQDFSQVIIEYADYNTVVKGNVS